MIESSRIKEWDLSCSSFPEMLLMGKMACGEFMSGNKTSTPSLYYFTLLKAKTGLNKANKEAFSLPSLLYTVYKISVPLCDTNFATRDRSFLSIFKCLSHFFWRNRKSFLNGTNAILKFENLASRCNFFRFLFALQLFLINF